MKEQDTEKIEVNQRGSEETKVIDTVAENPTGEMPAVGTETPKNKKPIIIAIIAVVVVILIGVGIAVAVGNSKATTQPDTSESTAVVNESEDAQIHVKVNCDGWDKETSTPIILSVYKGDVSGDLASSEEDKDIPDTLFTKELVAGEDTVLDDITESGTYTLAITGSPVLEDGTLFDLPEPQVIEFNGEKGKTLEFDLAKKSADKVTEKDIAAAQKTAAKAGVDTTKITNNANKATEKASSAQGGYIQQGNSGNNNSGNSNTGNNNNSGNNGSSNSQPSTPAHQHTPVTVPAKYENQTVITGYNHHDAVYKGIIVCLDCGARDVDNGHLEDHILNGGNGQYRTESVLVSPAYDEPIYGSKQVLVEEGYTYCSSCGQRL